MGSRLFETDLLTGHEPENRKSLEINEAILRFMERERRFKGSRLFEIDLLPAKTPTLASPSATPPRSLGIRV
jgi:hypothetical protein